MTFRGFLIESKDYMSYARMSKNERIRFWLRFPFAWLRFQWSGLTMRAADGLQRVRNLYWNLKIMWLALVIRITRRR